LSKQFDARGYDPEVIRSLDNELSHRGSDDARELRDRVRARLGTLCPSAFDDEPVVARRYARPEPDPRETEMAELRETITRLSETVAEKDRRLERHAKAISALETEVESKTSEILLCYGEISEKEKDLIDLRASIARKDAEIRQLSDGRVGVEGEDPFKTVGLTPHASPIVIDAARKALQREFHPDRFPTDKKDWAELRFRRVNEIFDQIAEAKR